MELSVRKSPRIPGYDYTTPNYYFITICTDKKKNIFWKDDELNEKGIIARDHICRISSIYPQIVVDHYVIMPNHVHMILVLNDAEDKTKQCSVDRIVGQYKMSVTKQIHHNDKNCKIWQRSFHDHIIRNQKSYEQIWQYITDNPRKWHEDCFYQEESCV